MKRKGAVTNPLLRPISLLRPIEFTNYENDAEVALVAFREACRGADGVGMELVGDFIYTGKKQQITIRIRNINGSDDSVK